MVGIVVGHDIEFLSVFHVLEALFSEWGQVGIGGD